MAFFVIFVIGVIWLFTKTLNGSMSIFYGGVAGALVYTAISYYYGSKMALAINRAKQIKKSDDPRLWRIIENLSITDGLTMPAVYIMNDPSPNAFATGRDQQHAAVCVTSGLLDIMDDDELQGVIAHELSHIKNYDMRVNMIAYKLIEKVRADNRLVVWPGQSRLDELVPPCVQVEGTDRVLVVVPRVPTTAMHRWQFTCSIAGTTRRRTPWCR